VADRPNPKSLNSLQLKTLVILQALADDRRFANEPEEDGSVLIHSLPQAHGNHFHVGDAVVAGKDASGLSNVNVYNALARKGLVLGGPRGLPILTAEGRSYDTGVGGTILHRADH
jgi:hypothetical protein